MKLFRRTILILGVLGLLIARPWPRYVRLEIVGHSMVPTLNVGDYVFARREPPIVSRGDIAVFQLGGKQLVKRVVGLPNEEIMIDGGIVTIDGVACDDSFWSGATRPDGQWSTAADEFFVLGDNRHDSIEDSRSVGPIRKSAIESVVVGRYWPMTRIGSV